MSDEASFLQTIQDDLDDDAVRLVFADWLEEHGQPERAEFIRVQIDLTRLPVTDARLPALRARQRELRRAHSRTWEKVLRKFARSFDYERGFLDHITLPAPKFLEHADEILRLHPIQHLKLNKVKNVLADVAKCPALARIRSLRLDPADGIGQRRFPTLLASPYLTRLTSLSLDSQKIGQSGLAALLRSPLAAQLKSLNLHNNELTDRALIALAQVSSALPQLTELIIDYNDFGEDGMRALARSPLMAHLTSLKIDWNPVMGDRGIIALAESPNARRLARLDLTFQYRLSWDFERDQAGFGDEALQALAASPHLTSLRDLNLAENTRIRSRGMEALARSDLMGRLTTLNLTTLGIVSPDLSPERLAQVVASAPQARNLTTLRLPLNRLNAAAVRTLALSPHLAGLGILDLSDNSLTEEAAFALAASPHLNALTHLMFTRTPEYVHILPNQWGPAAMEALRERFGPLVCDF